MEKAKIKIICLSKIGSGLGAGDNGYAVIGDYFLKTPGLNPRVDS